MSGQFKYLFSPLTHRQGRCAEPHILLGAPHELRGGLSPFGEARQLLRGEGEGRHGADHHRRTVGPPHRPRLRQAHRGIPARSDPGLQEDHKGRPRIRDEDLRPDQSQRPTVQRRPFEAACVGPVPGSRPHIQRNAQGDGDRGHRGGDPVLLPLGRSRAGRRI